MPEPPGEPPEVIRRYERRWVIVGPCLDGGWYAWPRRDETGARVQAASLDELGVRLGEREAGP
jgi:hypothetical protein